MHIYLKNIPAKFHHDPIWNDEAFGILDDWRPKKINEKNNKMSSDMGLVSDPKITT